MGSPSERTQNQFIDSAFRVVDDGDVTKKAAFQASGITTGNTRTITVPDSDTKLPIISQILTVSGPSSARTYTLPDASTTLVGTTDTQTLTNKTYDTPIFRGLDGWIDANETWTYASGVGTNVGTFTISGVDTTGKYQAGDKIKFTQTTVKYAVITKVAFSTDTTVTIYMGTDYTIANAAISANYYSKDSSPQGFPRDPAKWTITTSESSSRSTGNQSLTSLTTTITTPIGAWKLSLDGVLAVSSAVTASRTGKVTLSSDGSTETNTKLTLGIQKANETASSSNYGFSSHSEELVTVAASTTWTMMGLTSASGTTIAMRGDITPTLIRAICAYI